MNCNQGHEYDPKDAVPTLGCPICLEKWLEKGKRLD